MTVSLRQTPAQRDAVHHLEDQAAPPAPADDAAAGRYRLLVADDSEPIRALLRALISVEPDLRLIGEAADGAATLELVESAKADLLVLDIDMTPLDGLEVLKRLQTSRPSVQVVVYSGLTDPNLDAQARRLGAADYLVKGVPPQELIDRIRLACVRAERAR